MNKDSQLVITEFLDRKEQEMLEDLKTLVNLESGSRDKAGVDKAGALLKKWWEEEGFEVETYEAEDVGDSYVARINTDSDKPKVVMIGHFDTVFPVGEVYRRPFEIREDLACGPGAGDMKGGIVSMVYVIKALKEADLLHGPVSVVLNSHEEIGSQYTRRIIEEEVQGAGIVLNMEPARADGSVVTSRKGAAFVTMTIIGKASHSGVAPQEGASANLELAHRLIEMTSYTDYDKGLTVNGNVITGGSATNVISDLATAHFDIRFVRKVDLDELLEKVRESIKTPVVAGTSITISNDVFFYPIERRNNVLQAYQRVVEAGKKIGVEITESFTGGGSDAGFVAQFEDVPVIDGVGPISGKAHSVDEYMFIPSFAERTKVISIAIADLWQG